MPATFILIPAAVIGLIAWLAAWWHTRQSSKQNSRDEIQRLKNQALWLEQRLDIARREKWERTMVVQLSDELGAACHRLSEARLRAEKKIAMSVH